MPKCNQCNNDALYKLSDGVLLCLNCYEKVARILQTNLTFLMAQQNQLLDHMDEITGIPSYARYKIPQPIIYKDNKIQNFINVSESVIGSINTGILHSLNQSMNNINNNIDPNLANLFSNLANAILKSTELGETNKKEALENLDFITEQINLPDEQKKKSLAKKTFNSLKEILHSSSSLITLYQGLQPYIDKIFANGI